MTGIHPHRNLLVDTERMPQDVERKGLERVRDEQLTRIEMLHTSLLEMHELVAGIVTKSRARQLHARNKKTNVVQPKFNVGYFVLVRRAQDKVHKMSSAGSGLDV